MAVRGTSYFLTTDLFILRLTERAGYMPVERAGWKPQAQPTSEDVFAVKNVRLRTDIKVYAYEKLATKAYRMEANKKIFGYKRIFFQYRK